VQRVVGVSGGCVCLTVGMPMETRRSSQPFLYLSFFLEIYII